MMDDEYWLAIILIDSMAFVSLLSLTNNLYVAIGVPIAIDILLPVLRIRQRKRYQERQRPVNTETFWKVVETNLVSNQE